MKVTTQLLNEEIAKIYNQVLRDCTVKIEANKEKTMDMLNDCIVALYDRIDKSDEGFVEMKNIGGYLARCVYFSKISNASPYQRKRGMQHKYITIEEARKEGFDL